MSISPKDLFKKKLVSKRIYERSIFESIGNSNFLYLPVFFVKLNKEEKSLLISAVAEIV